ncbi:MAG: hypothetical protein AAF490_30085 [Chloroflexota bacterium]
MYRKLFLIIGFLAFLVPTGFVLAQDASGRQIDDTVPNDVTIVNENVAVSELGRVNGSLTVVNGQATVHGTVTEDVVVFNGDLVLGETAVIRGECVTISGTITGEGRSSSCQVIDDIPFVNSLLNSSEAPPIPDISETDINPNVLRIIGTVMLTLIMGVVATGFQALAPIPTQRIEDAMRERPFASTAVGVLSFGAVPFINILLLAISIPLVIVCVGILGFPIVIALTLGFIAAGFWAWVLWGKMFGDWVTQRLNLGVNRTVMAVIGTAVITFVLSFIAFSGPGWMLAIFLLTLIPIAWGMGATALTRFGTREFPLPIIELIEEPALDKDKVLAILDTLPDDQDH